MLFNPSAAAIGVFDRIDQFWFGKTAARLVSSFLAGAFIMVIVLAQLTKMGVSANLWFLPEIKSYFTAIDVAFACLLIYEMMGLVFLIVHSVADAIGKQFEILALLLLRAAFKEFGHFHDAIVWQEIAEAVWHMLSDAFGALVIFAIASIYTRIQKHARFTGSDSELGEFVTAKKILALVLLLIFSGVGVTDLQVLIETGTFEGSFNLLYTILIFTDVLILLISLRYTTQFSSIFRYSAFAFATVLVRLSLAAPPYFNVILGIAAPLFVLLITLVQNKLETVPDNNARDVIA